ncbi:hypothetical protein WME98_32245 [Sorangium sp. So ce296]|uniref:hypothetical protein n=1 Tax=Sorangium sp. So ce296 TaxID=3133296 RepID=UPI003F62C00A
MTSRRQQLSDYYRLKAGADQALIEKSAASAQRYKYYGDQLTVALVVRADLNGYSKWAREKEISERVALLDEFFSRVVPTVEDHGGVYFRDEGDCIVCIFSPYFGVFEVQKSMSFCKQIVGQVYGPDELTAKVTIACDSKVAFFQKAHERGTDDWSAEGEAFVRAARLEQAIPSRPRIYAYAAEYDILFHENAPTASAGERYYWTVNAEKLQVPGLSLAGGWTDVKYLEYVPGGRIQM